MATEEDNFDIDIYGDGGDGGDDYQHDVSDEPGVKNESVSEPTSSFAEANSYARENPSTIPIANSLEAYQDPKHENGHMGANDTAQKIASTDDSTQDPVPLPKQAPQTQGLKRKDGSDDRVVDFNATTALFISELHWWVTDDDVRGWANQSQCEDELEDITFSEHKVNGKSKGQAYVLFKSPQAATAVKQKIESFGEGQTFTKRFTVSYTSPFSNPFRTLPKDGPMRNSNPPNTNRSTPSGFGSAGALSNVPPTPIGFNMNNSGGGYRGNRGGGYANRGGGMNGMSNYNRGGFQQAMTGGFQGNTMNGFQGAPIGGMASYGGFQNRGGMMGGMRGGQMGMRGGRGGAISPNGMMGMPMNGMGMGSMGAQMNGMGMGMPQMGAMAMQGMQASHNYPNANSVGNHPFSATPTGQQYPLSNLSRRHESSTNPAGQYESFQNRGLPSILAGGVSRDTQPSQGHTWSALTQYAPSATNTAPTRFPSQFVASTSPVNPSTSDQNGLLNRSASRAGQGGFQGAQAHYNPAFFPQQSQGPSVIGGDAWNPHGAKRTRQE